MKENPTATDVTTNNKKPVNGYWLLQKLLNLTLAIIIGNPYKVLKIICCCYQDIRKGKHREQKPFSLLDMNLGSILSEFINCWL